MDPIAAIAAGIAFVIILSVKRLLHLEVPKTPGGPFEPNPLNDKLVLIRGWTQSETQKIVADFTRSYKDGDYPRFTINQEDVRLDTHKLTFPNDIHPDLLAFLVNYLNYPIDFELKGRTIAVVGLATLDVSFEGVDSRLYGRRVRIYVPDGDEDYDIVYLNDGNGLTLAFSFTNCAWAPTKERRMSESVNSMVRGA